MAKTLKLNKLIQDLQQLADQSYVILADIEDIHAKADELLLNYINNKEVSSAFKRIYKWYS